MAEPKGATGSNDIPMTTSQDEIDVKNLSQEKIKMMMKVRFWLGWLALSWKKHA